MPENLRIVRYLPEGKSYLGAHPAFVDMTDPAALSGLIEGADGFLVDGEGLPETLEAFVRTVRGDIEACIRPVFFTVTPSDEAAALGDGLVGSLEELIKRVSEMTRLSREIRLDALAQGKDHRLLAYLYLRGDGEIRPLRRPFSPRIYAYPTARCLDGEEVDDASWLARLAERGLIRRGRLVDRIRLCPRCACSHLNFVDVCPNCGSIDIEKKKFIHCFTCGRVASQEEFVRENFLQCPFCHARLRHLGADYDHPLESYECNDCSHRFVEPDVVARCHCCGTVSRPDDLVPRNVYGYGITEKGRTSARVGSLEEAYSLLDRLDFIVPAYFYRMLDWFIRMNRRYPDATFSLLGLRFLHLVELAEAQGQARVTELVEGLAERLHEVIRTTDMGMRNSMGTVWLLLPRTDPKGCRILEERLASIRELIPGDAAGRPVFRTVRFSSPVDLDPADNARVLISRLSEALED